MYVRLLKIGSNTWNKGTNMKKIEFEKKMEIGGRTSDVDFYIASDYRIDKLNWRTRHKTCTIY